MAWSVVSGENIYTQEKDNSCGPASVVMILRLMQNRTYDASYVRDAFGKEEGGANISKEGVRDFMHIPSKNDIIGSVLNKYSSGSWRSLFNATYLKRYMDKCTASKPGVLHISWTHQHDGTNWQDISANNYGHWVVLKETNGLNYTILDPGGVVGSVAVTQHGNYRINYGGNWMYGNIDGIITSQ